LVAFIGMEFNSVFDSKSADAIVLY